MSWKICKCRLTPFLYNSLETVCGIIDAGEDKLAIRMINYISRFYRGVLSGGDTLVTIDQEVQITLRYLEIVKIRYRNSFEFDYNFPKEMIQAKTPRSSFCSPLWRTPSCMAFSAKKAMEA